MFNRYSTLPQPVALCSSVLISLSAGTNYAFSIYSVQLGQQLHLSATWLNAVGLAGNLGMYLSAPFVGTIVDRHGPTIPLLAAGTFISSGYGLLWFIFSYPFLPGPSSVFLPILGNLLTGIGSSIANTCAVTAIAAVFEPTHRASAIGTVLAGFGLSAFFWSTIGSWVAKSDTSTLLALLSFGPGLLILIGGMGYLSLGLAKHSYSLIGLQSSPLSRRSSLPNPINLEERQSSEASRLLTPKKATNNVSGWNLVKDLDFWMIFIVMSCCAGIALMMINNIGTMIAAIYMRSSSHQKETTVGRYQAHAVSMISILNCFGRVFAGTIADGLKRYLSFGRVWWLSWISILFLTSQLFGYYLIDSLNGVVWLGGLVGFSYGNLYGTAPALVLEWFGLENFATNFGCLNLSPLLTGQIFNLSFGKIFDHHSNGHQSVNLESRSVGMMSDENRLSCKEGRNCYRDVFLITILGSLISLCVSILLAFRRPEFFSEDNPNLKRIRRVNLSHNCDLDNDDNEEEDEVTAPILNSSDHNH